MRYKIIRFALALALPVTTCAGAFADSGTVNFGSFYGAAGGRTVSILEGTAGVYTKTSGGFCNTPVGMVQLPVGWNNLTGHATNMINISFSPNLVDGSFSGSCTATYSNSSSNGPTSLTLTVTYSGDSMVPKATAGLKYEILSILYSPPGNASNNGFTNTQSAGSTTSVSQNFTSSDSITFSAGAPGVSSSVTFSTSQSAGNRSSFTTNYQASSSSQLTSVTQAINHNEDQVFILIDPSITITQTGTSTGFYSFGGSLHATGFGTGGPPPDIINVNIAGLKNPSSIPLEILEPQVPQPGVTLPGLSFICAKPLPPSQCTQQNACGCTPADFAPIVAQDSLANVTDQATAPSTVASTRFLFINSISLQGPQQQGAGPVRNTYSLSDSAVSSTETSSGSSYGVSYSQGFGQIGLFSLGITATTGFTYAQTQTAGTTNGTAHVGTVTLGTSDVGCSEFVDVYEDTIYHTFAFSLPQEAPANCQ